MFREEITHHMIRTFSNPYIGLATILNLRLIITNLLMIAPLKAPMLSRFSILPTILTKKTRTSDLGQVPMGLFQWSTAITNIRTLSQMRINIFLKIMDCLTLIVKASKILKRVKNPHNPWEKRTKIIWDKNLKMNILPSSNHIQKVQSRRWRENQKKMITLEMMKI